MLQGTVKSACRFLAILGLLSITVSLPATASAQTAQPNSQGVRGPKSPHSQKAVCDAAPAGVARCHAHLRTDPEATGSVPAAGARAPRAAPDVVGNNGAYDPSYLQSAYNTPSASGGSGQTIAIVDAYDNPNAEADLGTYRSNFGLPACTTANGCFRKVNQNGATSPLPAANASWGQEIALDLDMASA